MKQNFTVRHGALDGVEAFLSVAQHRSFRKAAAELGVTTIGDQPGDTRGRGARRRSTFHPHDAQRWFDRSRRAIPVACKARFRGACRRKRGRARPWTAACRSVAPICAAGGGADPVGAADRILLPGLSGDRGGDRRKPGPRRYRCRRIRRRHPARPVHRGRYGRGASDAVVPAGCGRQLRLSVPAKAAQRIDDLRGHACLRMRRSNGSIAPWSFVNGNEAIEAIVSGPFIANDVPTLLGAAVEGLGLAQMPRQSLPAP